MNKPPSFNAKAFLKTVTSEPGVYRMYDHQHQVIYVGKAKNLKKRLSSYFQKNLSSKKTQALVNAIASIDTTLTHSETEALLLEHNFIKQYQPRYNVLLRDDKSYPYILLTHETHPRLTLHRGSKKIAGDYFGPYPNVAAVHETLYLLQKLFPIRQCSNTVYHNRSRPCLQYQIKRCLAPCVPSYTTNEDYQKQVDSVRLFLEGKDQQVLEYLVQQMEQASLALNFEEAAHFRDQIQSVRTVIEKQFVSSQHNEDADILSIAYQFGIACVQVLFIRHGKVFGNRSYFPKIPANTDLAELTETFLGQFYLQGHQGRTIPHAIVLDQTLQDKSTLQNLLSEKAGHKVVIQDNVIGQKSQYLKLAQTNAKAALVAQLKQASLMEERFLALQKLLHLNSIKRMECFDISHTMGEQTIASCVVFNQEGPLKSDYRRYTITGITPGDDYAAMEQALNKRYNRSLDPDKVPDVIFIDGGHGQLNRAKKVFTQLQVNWDKTHPQLIGVAKGKERKAGWETLILSQIQQEINLPSDHFALHLIQHIRDESHRHAITGHRKKRQKAFNHSRLEDIPNIGPKRRQALLKYLGGMQGVLSASQAEIESVPGISKQLAQTIYDFLKD